MKNQTKVLIGVLVLALAVAGYFLFGVRNNPKTVFAVSIDDTYTKMADMFTGFREGKLMTLGGVVSSDTKITFAFDGDVDQDAEMADVAALLDGMGINYYLVQDKENKKMALDLEVLVENQKTFGGKMYAQEDLTYFFVEELFDRYIGTEDFNLFNEDTDVADLSKEIEYLAEKTKDLFLDSLLNEYFESEKTTTEVNNQEVAVTKNTFMLNNERVKEILEYIIKGLKNDEKAIDAIISVSAFGADEITRDEVVEELDEALADLEDEEIVFDGEVIYIIYSEGVLNKAIKHDLTISYKDEFTDTNQVVQIVYSEYENDADKSVGDFILNVDGNKMGTLMVVEVDDDKTEYTVEVFDNEVSMFVGKITITSTETEVVKDKEYKTVWNLKVEFMVDDQEVAFSTNIESLIKVVDEVEMPDASMLVMFDDLSENEQTEIQNQLYQIMGLFGGFMMEPNYDDYQYEYDYDYDYEYDYDFDDFDYDQF